MDDKYQANLCVYRLFFAAGVNALDFVKLMEVGGQPAGVKVTNMLNFCAQNIN